MRDRTKGIAGVTSAFTASQIRDFDKNHTVHIWRDLGDPCVGYAGSVLLRLVADESILELWRIGAFMLSEGLTVALIKSRAVG
jgi:hypothetical protein